MLDTETKLYSYKDVMIQPKVLSRIEHRKECNPYTPKETLPIFTAPMSTVVGVESYHKFLENKIIPILPRNVKFTERWNNSIKGGWSAYSLMEIKERWGLSKSFYSDEPDEKTRILIDLANGHMKGIYELVKNLKDQYEERLEIMVGNIARPETITECIKAGVDYVRCGVGAGEGCITSSNTAIHFPMASLISYTRELRDMVFDPCRFKTKTKIIADGGIRGYGDVIKALALGADYVMIGGLFAGCLEAEGPYRVNPEFLEKLNQEQLLGKYSLSLDKIKYDQGHFTCPAISKEGTTIQVPLELERVFYGMASKQGQRDITGGFCPKTAEGISKTLPITITLGAWVENMEAYLRSAMSYCDCKTLGEIYEKMTCNIVSPYTALSINK